MHKLGDIWYKKANIPYKVKDIPWDLADELIYCGTDDEVNSHKFKEIRYNNQINAFPYGNEYWYNPVLKYYICPRILFDEELEKLLDEK